jgi:hypothetical protein
MTKVIKEVVAEVRGKSDQFAAEMAKVEARVKQTKTSVEQLGAGNAAMGQRTAEAARQIASATETIARQGKITGEAGKQIVAQASNIAFAFGPQGALVGALGIFAVAFGSAMSRAKREAAEAAESVKKSIADMLNAGDIEALKADARRLYFGTRAEGFTDGIQPRRTRLAELRAELEGPTTNPFNVLPRKRAIEDETAALAKLEAQYQAVREAIFGFTQDPAAVGGLGATRITAAGPGAASKALPDGAAASAAFQKEADAFAKDFAALLVRELGGAGDEIRAEFNRLIEAASAAGRENAVDQLIDLRDKAVAAAEAIGAAEALLQRLDIAAAQGLQPGVAAFQDLTASAEQLQAQLAQLVPGTERYEQVLAEIEKIEKRRQDLLKGVADGGAAPGTPKAARDMADYARELQQAADGALQLAAAFGLVDASSTSALRAIGQIAGNVPALVKAINAGSGLGILSAALPILGSLASLVGQDPAEAARRQAIEENTNAIRELTAKAGLLGLGVSGSEAGSALERLTAFVRRYEDAVRLGGDDDARRAAKAAGLSLSELDEIAEKHGITLNGSIDSFIQLIAAIDETRVKLGEFGTDLESQLRQASAAAQVFGITDPQALLGLTQSAYAGRSPALDRALAGLDLSTAEGREAARTALQDIFRTMQAGGGRLSDADLGGLDGDELLQAILDLIGGLNDVDESLGLNTSTVGQGDRVITADQTQITADQASRMLGVLTTIMGEVRRIREWLTGTGLELLPPPPLIPSPLDAPALRAGFAGGGGVVVNVYVTNDFDGTATERQIAASVRGGLLDAIDQGLGKRALLRERHQGKAVKAVRS